MKKIATSVLLALSVFLSTFLAQALDWKELHEKADQISFNDARELMPRNLESLEDLYVIGLVYLNAHKDKEALDIFGRMLSLNPDTVAAKWGKAECLRRLRKLNESEKLLEEVLKEDKKFYPAYITLSYLRYTQLDFKNSVKLAKKVKNKGRDEVDLSNYVRAYLLIGGGKGMLAYYGGPIAKIFNGMSIYPNLKKAEGLQPNAPAVLFGLGSFYFLAPKVIGGNLDKAEDYLTRAIEADPQFADAYVRLAQVYRMKGESQKYEAYMKKALAIDPENELAKDEESGECKFICVSVNE